MKICILMGVTPFPARKNGLTLRYYALAKSLSETDNEVSLRIFPHIEKTWNQDDIDALQAAGIKTTAADSYPIKTPSITQKIRARVSALLPSGKPLSQISYNYKTACDYFNTSEDFSDFDVVLAVTSSIFELYDQLPKAKKAKMVVWDEVDSLPLHFYRRYQAGDSVLLSKKYEFIKYKAWERDLINRADKACYISKVDASFSRGDADKIIVLPNGIEHSELHDAPLVDLHSDSIGFVGDMAYRPNVKAVKWFLDNVWPDYVEKNPSCYFYIVGRSPEQSVYDEAAKHKNVVVTGSVDNIWSYYKSIKLFVCPLFSGAGLQNKVIEAMFASKPVISTTIANAGVNAVNGESIILADTAEQFTQALNTLRHDASEAHRIGDEGRRYATKNFDWSTLTEQLLTTFRSHLGY